MTLLHAAALVVGGMLGTGVYLRSALMAAGLKNGILNVMIEVRNDLLQTQGQCTKIAGLLAAWLSEAHEICRSDQPPLEAKA